MQKATQVGGVDGPICYKCLLGPRVWVSTETSGSQPWLPIQILWGDFKTPGARLFLRPIISKFLWVGPRSDIFTLTPKWRATES